MDLVEEMVVKHEFKKELDKYGVSFFYPSGISLNLFYGLSNYLFWVLKKAFHFLEE